MNENLKLDIDFNSPEMDLLVACLSTPGPGKDARVEKLLSIPNIDWDVFTNLAVRRHSVIGQVTNYLSRYRTSGLPEAVWHNLNQECLQSAFKILGKTVELIKLLNQLLDNGIKALPLKGPVLGVQLYDNIGIRKFLDLDIVVPVDCISKAEKVLFKCGYIRVYPPFELSNRQRDEFFKKKRHYNYKHPENKILVELHWKITSDHIWPVKFDDIWKNRQTINIGGKQLQACALDDMLIPLLVHGAEHCWWSLFWLNDIRIILENYDDQQWKTFLQRIENTKIKRLALSTILLLNRIFYLDLPEAVDQMISKTSKVDLLVKLSIYHIKAPSIPNHASSNSRFNLNYKLSNFFLVPGIRYKLTYLAKWLDTCDYDYINLPDRLFILYYLFRPFFAFFKKFTAIRPARIP